jgi:ATP-dependent helicase/nuclease subunit A
VRKLSFTALSSFERCSYRYYAERVVGMRGREDDRSGDGEGLAATAIGSAVHSLLEEMDLRDPRAPADLEERVRGAYPSVSDEELARIRGFVEAYCESPLARRVAGLEGVKVEQHFLFEHDDVLLHGYLDVYHRDGARALVVDYKTNLLGDRDPDEIVEHEYSLQRLVYALACLRAGAEEVEVAYQFLERPDAPVSTTFGRDQVPELEAALSAAIAAIHAAEFRPTPSVYACSGCPVLDVVCAGPRLLGPDAHLPALAVSGA